jgi:prepilin-type N-terminal cleavage/methylation domain-containing protein
LRVIQSSSRGTRILPFALDDPRSAFTLIELLVVIGIIALLISILLPTLSAARASANKIKCASQLRQVGQWVAMYAAGNRNFIPIGWLSNDSYVPGTSTLWYMQKSSFTNGPVSLGYLFSSGIAKNTSRATRAVWYCPVMPNDWRFALDKSTNPWVDLPISDTEAAAWPSNNVSLKMGYSSRAALTSKLGDEQTLRWTAATGVATAWTRPVYTSTFANANANLRSTSALKSKAIVSDMVGDPRLVLGLHKKGVNVLYANYAVKWVPLEEFKTDLANTSINPSPTGNYIFSGDWFALFRIWEDFDRQ